MPGRRTLAALTGTVLVVLVVCFGAGPAGAATSGPVVDAQAAPAAVSMMPAQLPEPTDDDGTGPGEVLIVAGLALFLGGSALTAQVLRVTRPVRVRRHVDAIGYAGVARCQLLAS